MGRRKRQKTGATYSSEEIKVLKQQPGVIEVTPDMIIFDLEFKQELYDVWARNQCMDTIRKFFAKRGADIKAIPNEVFARFQRNFRLGGRPQFQALPLYDKRDGEGIPHAGVEH